MATKLPWQYSVNPFLNVTSNSYRLAVRISTYHLGALEKASAGADPFFVNLLRNFKPLHDALELDYETWGSQGGTQQGETLNVNQLLNLLRATKIRKWDTSIQVVYDRTTPDYKKLLPNNRAPFQKGTQTDREAAIKSLAINLQSADARLTPILDEVNDFHKLLSDALDAQKGEISGTKTKSTAVDSSRLAMCTGQYANLGLLINHFAGAPENINAFFDLVAIREGSQVIFTGDTKPEEYENIFRHTMEQQEELLLENEGDTALAFYYAALKSDAPGSYTQITVPPHTNLRVSRSQFGANTNAFLNVYNADTITKGDWTVEIE